MRVHFLALHGQGAPKAVDLLFRTLVKCLWTSQLSHLLVLQVDFRIFCEAGYYWTLSLCIRTMGSSNEAPNGQVDSKFLSHPDGKSVMLAYIYNKRTCKNPRFLFFYYCIFWEINSTPQTIRKMSVHTNTCSTIFLPTLHSTVPQTYWECLCHMLN